MTKRELLADVWRQSYRGSDRMAPQAELRSAGFLDEGRMPRSDGLLPGQMVRLRHEGELRSATLRTPSPRRHVTVADHASWIRS